jgi:ArsR family transcriptional regulator, cadmium/lead-responsive transcriptional repressor
MSQPFVSPAIDDDLWSAIGDPTRRQMLDLLLATGSGTATSLSERLPVSRQAVAKHLAVLDRTGLVHGETSGRERQYRIDDEQFERALDQLHAVSTAWDGRLRRIKRLAESIQQATRPQRTDEKNPKTEKNTEKNTEKKE